MLEEASFPVRVLNNLARLDLKRFQAQLVSLLLAFLLFTLLDCSRGSSSRDRVLFLAMIQLSAHALRKSLLNPGTRKAMVPFVFTLAVFILSLLLGLFLTCTFCVNCRSALI
jgi:hypothetical protein